MRVPTHLHAPSRGSAAGSRSAAGRRPARYALSLRSTRAGRRWALVAICFTFACLAIAGVAAATGSAKTSATAARRGARAHAAASTYRFGISDYEPSTFSDPRVGELGVHLARDVVPWNAALNKRDRAELSAWLYAVKQAYHVTPFITFQHADNNGSAPSPGEFLYAFRRFRKLFPWVTEFSPWDEATHTSQPTAYHPYLAAAYYNVLAANCRGCQVTAPDVLDADGNVEGWIRAFLRRAHPYPQIWPFNPYHSISDGSPELIENFLAAVHGQVWFSEVGGVVWWRYKGRLIEHGESYAARVARNIFKLAKLSGRITRVYYYHWRSPGTPRRSKKATWDAGLVRSNGAARPAMYVVASELHRYFQKSIPKIF